jgi:hypothetical protein
MHPVRWMVTLYLVSWEPAVTTDEARQRYEAWATARREAKATKRATATVQRLTEVEDSADDYTDPWDRAVPVEEIDPDADLAAWAASDRGQAEVATARVAVATATKQATYDREAAKAMVRRELDRIDPGLPPRAQGEARRQVDVAVAAEFGISERTARKLRGEATDAPVSGPPSDSE